MWAKAWAPFLAKNIAWGPLAGSGLDPNPIQPYFDFLIDAHLTCGSRSSAILDRKVLLILLPFTFKLPLSTFSPFCQFNRVSPRTFSLLCLHVWYTRTTFKEEKEVWYGKLHTHLDFSYCCDFYLNLWQLA